ncbi:MAG: hypothetical protein RIC87_16200 [Kiloniellales bacterium]
MRSCGGLRLIGATLGLYAITALAAGSSVAESKPKPPPPYIMKGMDATYVNVTWDSEMIDALLPEGLTPLEGYTGGINLYSVPKGYGLAPYSAAYFYVNVDFFVSSSGIPGRYILGGVFGPAAAAEAMNEHYGWRMREGLAVQLVKDGVVTSIAQREAEPLFTIKMTNVTLDCPDFNGVVHYVSPATDEAFTVLEVPFSAQICEADIAGGVDISAPEDDPLSRFKIDEVINGVQLRDASFAYTKPEIR